MTRREPRIVRPRMARRLTQQPPDRAIDDVAAIAWAIAFLLLIFLLSSLVPGPPVIVR